MKALVLTCGREEYLARTVETMRARVQGLSELVVVDDSGDPEHLLRVRQLDGVDRVEPVHPTRNLGYTAAMAEVYRLASDAEFTFVSEDDFTYERPIDLNEIAAVMRSNPHLRQMALRRQPWYPAEIEAGGVMEHAERRGLRRRLGWTNPAVRPASLALGPVSATHGKLVEWEEHRLYWTNNPHVLPIEVARLGWPRGRWSEAAQGRRIFRDPQAWSGVWGLRESGWWVEHIGHEKAGHGY
jgi:glycosyltransferase involved in cell wall biosynthesis